MKLMIGQKHNLTKVLQLTVAIGALTATVSFLRSGSLANTSKAPAGSVRPVEAVWISPEKSESLKSWLPAELLQINSRLVEEKNHEGRSIRWKGILFSKWIEQALEALPLASRAQVDLLILKTASGAQAIIPRYVITRFPILLATPALNKVDPTQHRPFSVVVPGNLVSKLLDQGLPVGTFSVQDITEIQLTSYRAKFSSLFLKRRTDPAAIRGEKMFVQNCVSCHSAGRGLSLDGHPRNLASSGHPKASGITQLSDRDVRALISYLQAYRSENPSAAAESDAADQRASAQPQAAVMNHAWAN